MRLIASLFVFCSACVSAGDDASGTNKYRVDLGKPFSKYELTDKDQAWAKALAAKFKYSGRIVYFVKTSLPLDVDGKTVEGDVYQSLEKPTCFYVAQGDAMLPVGAPWPLSPGTGGLSMHTPRSRNFIACLNCHCGGVPFLSGSRVERSVVTWNGNKFTRF